MLSAKFNGPECRAVREGRGWNIERLADEVGKELGRKFHFTSISKFERGDREPSAETYNAICKVLKVGKKRLLIEAA